jgi:hypothetical protein
MFEPSADGRQYTALGANGRRYRIGKEHVEGQWFVDEWAPDPHYEYLGSYTGAHLRGGTWEKCRQWAEERSRSC